MVGKGETVVTVGTRKGLFLFHSRDRRRWRLEGPFFEGVPVHHALLDPRDGRTVWAGVTSDHWGPSVQRSRDFGARWLKPKEGPRYPAGSGLSVDRVWSLAPGADGCMWAGVEPAGLFRSDDGGDTWQGVEGLNAWPGRGSWMPGGGGLCMHTLLPHPKDARRMVVAASAVGIFATEDGGATWELRNGGILNAMSPAGSTQEDEPGTCPHKLVRDPAEPGTLYMQNHWGVYRRREGASKWTAIHKGLPSRFGFPMAAHPRDAGSVYTVPLVGDFNRVTHDGAMAVHRTRDGGKTWERLSKGLPQKGAWSTVLREGLATDGKDPAGVYVGTTTGELYASRDEGDSWTALAEHLPPILSVTAGIVGEGA
jgi:hypothetical protein